VPRRVSTLSGVVICGGIGVVIFIAGDCAPATTDRDNDAVQRTRETRLHLLMPCS